MPTLNDKKNIRTQRGILLLIMGSLGLLQMSCTPKSTRKNVHEGPKEYVYETVAEDNSNLEKIFVQYPLQEMEKSLQKMRKDEIFKKIIEPLSQLVLKNEIIVDPKYRGKQGRLIRMLSLFNQSYLNMVNDQSSLTSQQKEKLNVISKNYESVVFYECTSDLRSGCVNQWFFKSDARSSIIILNRVIDADSEEEKVNTKKEINFEEEIKNNKNFRQFLIKRYRLLAMAHDLKSNIVKTNDFIGIYIKYARPFALLLEWVKNNETNDSEEDFLRSGYLVQVHTNLVDSLIGMYQPQSHKDPDLIRMFEISNFWTFSNKQPELFKKMAQVMFDLAPECCLYEANSNDKKLSPLFLTSIKSIQEVKSLDEKELTFLQKVKFVYSLNNGEIFKRLNLIQEVDQILNQNWMYNEIFFIVDRLYNGHLDQNQAKAFISKINRNKVVSNLPNVISIYTKIQLIYMIVETNRYMQQIYQNKSVGSNDIFQDALTKSKSKSNEWFLLQAKFDFLEEFVGSYYNSIVWNSSDINNYNSFKKVLNDLMALNTNIHLLSVYPHMLVLSYYIHQKGGEVTASTWWGDQVHHSSESVIDDFLNGKLKDLWFRFSHKAEILNREMIVLIFDYAMQTKALESFNGEGGNSAFNRQMFFSSIFSVYLGSLKRKLIDDVNKYKYLIVSQPDYLLADRICKFELNADVQAVNSVSLSINFTELNKYTYSGTGENGIRNIISQFLGESRTLFHNFRTEIEDRVTFVKMIREVIREDFSSSNKKEKNGNQNSELEVVDKILEDIDKWENHLKIFFKGRQNEYFNCLLTLDEIEKHRMNRIYEEEKKRLEIIHQKLSSLANLTNPSQLNIAVNKINEDFFGKEEASTHQFDKIQGTTYYLSKYDLLLRISKMVNEDIFTSSSGSDNSQFIRFGVNAINRPRIVRVVVNPGIRQTQMFRDGTNVGIAFQSDLNRFIKNGLAVFNGTNDSFVEWSAQVGSQKEMIYYLETLINWYLWDNSTDSITPEDLIKTYLKIIISFGMSQFEIDNLKLIDKEGNKSRLFFDGWVYYKSYNNKLYLFDYLINKMEEISHLRIESNFSGNESLSALQQSFSFAQSINVWGTFIFPPSPQIQISVKKYYGDRIHHLLHKMDKLYTALDKVKSSTDAEIKYLLSEALNKSMYFSADGTAVSFAQNSEYLVNIQKRQNLNNIINNFIQSTNDFYQTKNQFLHK